MSPILLPLLLAPALQLQATPTPVAPEARTLLLQLDGDRNRLDVVRAWPRDLAFRRNAFHDAGSGELVLEDAWGTALFRCRLDLSDLNVDAKRPGDLAYGCLVLSSRVSILVKVPDLGDRVARLRLFRDDGDRRVELGGADARRLATLRAPALGPLLAPTVKTIINNGPVDNRYDIVIVGDGYQASEEAKFGADVGKWMTNLFGREPYKSYARFFNVHTVFRASKESGADQPDVSPPIVRDTVYDASYNYGGTARCLYVKNGSQASQDAALAPDVEGRIVVLVNDSRYGGCAGTYAVSYTGSSGPEVQTHEFGHSFGALADEYDYGRSGTYSGPEPGQANLTADKSGKTKWPLWMGYQQVSTYEGAGYYLTGLFRPEPNCLMRALGVPLCHVCVEQLVKQSYAVVDPITSPTPTPGPLSLTVPQKQTVSFTDLVPNGGKVEWRVDDKTAQQGGTSFVVDSTALGYGKKKLEVIVTDATTMVRKGTPVAQARWDLTINDPTLPDVSVKSFTAPSTAPSGSRLTLVTVVENLGQKSSGAFTLEHFISKGSTVGAGDTYLGAIEVKDLGPGKSAQYDRPLDLPLYLMTGKARLRAWLDRGGKVGESNLANNTSERTLDLTKATGCPVALEYVEALTWPATESTISLSTSGVRALQVTAPCNVGDWALVLWSSTGTSPGVTVGAVHVPLNWDPVCTSLGLATLNTGPFYLFFAKVDLAGRTTPLVYLDKPFPVAPFASDLAAVLFKADFSGISAASNAAGLDFVK
ncbi:MAG: M64 family metallopeptidase [Planctomycetota bacterium]